MSFQWKGKEERKEKYVEQIHSLTHIQNGIIKINQPNQNEPKQNIKSEKELKITTTKTVWLKN